MPTKTNVREYTTASERETLRLARNLARRFRGDEVVLLVGELGAGKTVFAKGLASGLGLEDIDQVCSPSYTLLNVYRAKYPIYHWDLYRLGDPREVSDLGWEDFLGEGVIIVEWAEKLGYEGDRILVRIEVLESRRRKIEIESDPAVLP